jgi:hypothetical protein
VSGRLDIRLIAAFARRYFDRVICIPLDSTRREDLLADEAESGIKLAHFLGAEARYVPPTASDLRHSVQCALPWTGLARLERNDAGLAL